MPPTFIRTFMVLVINGNFRVIDGFVPGMHPAGVIHIFQVHKEAFIKKPHCFKYLCSQHHKAAG